MSDRREKKDRRQNSKDLRLSKDDHRFYIRRNLDRSEEKEQIIMYYLLGFVVIVTLVYLTMKYLFI